MLCSKVFGTEMAKNNKGIILNIASDLSVIAPDQRGYSKGARPLKISEYTIDKLSQDVIDIANEFNIDKFHLVGHDWGSAVGWYLSSKFSDRIIENKNI